jgi:2-succinyl-6-hydroxy-2,4-cyclohexadiene-1-carboxylate synthase
VSAKDVGTPEAMVLLHGFAGTRHTWDSVVAQLDRKRYRPLALDLPGHGQASSHPRPITFDACAERVLDVAPERFALCGYSMGGRIALHVALAAPERVTRLVLVSSSPGIDDARERAERRRSDERLARELEREPFEAFIERWRTQPLFAEEPPRVGTLAREEHRRNDPDALAAALRGLGAGAMQPVWDRLAELSMPVTVLVGDRDVKYRSLAERMLQSIPRAQLLVLAGGHSLALESSAAVAQALRPSAA